jgi:arylsulfatase A-like enzyme
MNTFRCLRLVGLALLALAWGWPGGIRAADVPQPGAGAPPSILFVLTDDQRWDGAGFASDGAVLSPGLDQLRSRSIHFTRAYAVYSLCSPSRAAILTSQYGTRNGVNALSMAA